MRNEILANLSNPAELEQLYRGDKPTFRREFAALYPDHRDNLLVKFWNERLSFSQPEISWGTKKEFLFMLLMAMLGGIVAQLPNIFNWDEELFYSRNVGFAVLPMITAFFAWRNNLSTMKSVVLVGATMATLIIINSLPNPRTSDTSILACIHLLLFLWSLLGFSFIGGDLADDQKRLAFLKYNGDVVVMTTLIVIASGLLTFITIGLFQLIGLNIQEFFFRNIVVFGLPAAPIFATYLTQTNPQLVGKVSPLIARIFSPLVLVMLVVYLGAMPFSGKDPFNDREFLMLFNVLLIGVMAIIFFSIAESSKTERTALEVMVLFLLSIVTIIVNGIALSAIIFRISEWGSTPNRIAVMGANILILVNLVLAAVQLFNVVRRKSELSSVGQVIVRYLPVYFIWTIIVTFLFPLIFGFK